MARIITALFLMALLCVACYYDNEEYLYPDIGNSCDTSNVTFSSNVTAILGNNCLSCHSNSTAASFGNNIRLEDYADVKAKDQLILGSIKHSPGVSPMPKGGSKLNDCMIRQFEIWTNNGSPDN